MKELIAVMLFTVMIAGMSFGGERREIELTDGSTLSGEVLSLKDGVYTVRTESLGTITLDEARIRTIRQQGASARPAEDGSRLRSMQQQLMADPATLSQILSLRDDPAFRQVLEDPEILKAVEAGDIAALAANPRFLQLLNNPTVQDIQKKRTK